MITLLCYSTLEVVLWTTGQHQPGERSRDTIYEHRRLVVLKSRPAEHLDCPQRALVARPMRFCSDVRSSIIVVVVVVVQIRRQSRFASGQALEEASGDPDAHHTITGAAVRKSAKSLQLQQAALSTASNAI
nr:hypothetical protein CFP56_23812 [Quercus suber]